MMHLEGDVVPQPPKVSMLIDTSLNASYATRNLGRRWWVRQLLIADRWARFIEFSDRWQSGGWNGHQTSLNYQ